MVYPTRLAKLGVIIVMGLLPLVAVQAGYTWEYSDDVKCSIGGDIRLRLTHFDRNTISPDWGLLPDGFQGPGLDYMRMRERIWACISLGDDMAINVRLVNRWQYFSSNIDNPNMADDDYVWEFPDEVIVDQLNVDFFNVFGSNWSLRLGRQDFILGNGMVMLEGNPYDTGRDIYFDGITATYSDECNTLKLFGFYNDYKDRIVLINDRNRVLRRGETWIVGAEWVYRLMEQLNTNLYYVHIDIDDDRTIPQNFDRVERNHQLDENASLDVVGARLFGTLHPQVDYSGEVAFQFGEGIDPTTGNDADFSGFMIDARLKLKAPQDTLMDPALLLSVTHFSGDDQNSTGELEGWHPALAEYPIWREELMPIMLNGNWTNLTQYRAALSLNLYDSECVGVKALGSWALLIADHEENTVSVSNSEAGFFGAGGGDEIGKLISGFVDVSLKKYNLTFSLEAAMLDAGDYWVEGNTGEWLRFQTVWTF